MTWINHWPMYVWFGIGAKNEVGLNVYFILCIWFWLQSTWVFVLLRLIWKSFWLIALSIQINNDHWTHEYHILNITTSKRYTIQIQQKLFGSNLKGLSKLEKCIVLLLMSNKVEYSSVDQENGLRNGRCSSHSVFG